MYNLFKYNTEIPEELHQEFLRSIGLVSDEENAEQTNKELLLKQRKAILNKKFDFNELNWSMIELLCKKLKATQQQIFEKHIYLINKAKSELIENGGKFISTGENIHITFYFHELAENYSPLYETNDIYLTQIDCDSNVLIELNEHFGHDDSNELDLKLARLGMTKLFHHLYHESHLALQDILMIDLITFDISISYQTEVEIFKC